MNEIFKVLNKYIVLLIISSLSGMPWFYIQHFVFQDISPDSIVYSIPTYLNYFIRLLVITLLIIDFKKHKLEHVLISCVAAFFFPLLGIVSLGLLLLEKREKGILLDTVQMEE
jgi:hypothetical protein